ncbi:hypothetical protein HNQ91_003947 [Filimonas zeae]|uniref:Nucleotidyltransferase n=1 Tax=Filimonas zeae TaxID=1737353 RepID=A0A917MYF7_9BACT|nr:hypothetical protein [Filimonas zeae]MDR6340874.1 hypothetical protein [Filimonas zeae]GGH78113.1 hypothetical protein GCM10011379_45500 [Filimonas zeae]
MARTINEIQAYITNVYVTEMAAAGYQVVPAAWSKVNIQRLLIYIVAVCTWSLEVIFDVHRSDTENDIKALKPPTKEWYANKALAFQYGFPIRPETDVFDNTGYTDEQIETSKVVKYAAVVRQLNAYGRIVLKLKLAGYDGEDLARLSEEEIAAINAYFSRIEAAGDNLVISSEVPDKLRMKWRIRYDPLILDGNGNRLDGQGSDVVRTAIKSFLVDGMKFSGVYALTYHIDHVQKVEGIIIPEVLECAASYGNVPFSAISQLYEPDAGWLRFDAETDLIIEYLPQSAIQ